MTANVYPDPADTTITFAADGTAVICTLRCSQIEIKN
jgi:hypothetical protein